MSEALGADTLEPPPGQRLIEGAKEALAIARGEIPAARITINGHAYVPEAEAASLRAEKEELRRERDEARAKAEKDLREAGAHFAKSCEMADRALTAESLLAEAGKVLEPFAKSFDGRRDAHSRRHADRDLGYARFDKMPDEWRIEPAVFSMGAYRRARSVATSIASLTAKEPKDAE